MLRGTLTVLVQKHHFTFMSFVGASMLVSVASFHAHAHSRSYAVQVIVISQVRVDPAKLGRTRFQFRKPLRRKRGTRLQTFDLGCLAAWKVRFTSNGPGHWKNTEIMTS